MKLGLTTRLIEAGPQAVAEAARCLAGGGLVAFPTETVYGLGADAGNAEAIARLYQAKGRPAFNPLIAHVGGLDAARRIGHFDATAEALAEAFWPGPLTLVLPKAPGGAVADLATAVAAAAVGLNRYPDRDARELRAATADPAAPAPSVEAILHALIPHRFVDHTHADAVIAIEIAGNWTKATTWLTAP